MPTTTTSDGVTIAYLPLGGSGPNLLLAHATGFSATVWRPMAERLAERFTCWALDFRGHGLSTAPADGTYDWHGTALDALAVIDAVDADGTWFGAGHSMGGAALVLSEQRRPGTFDALWLYEPVIFPSSALGADDGNGGNFLADGAARRRPTFPSRSAAFDNYSSKPPMNTFDQRALEGYLERGLVPDPAPDAPEGGVRLACEPADEAQVYRMGGRHSAWAGLPEVSVPVTVVCGNDLVPGPGSFAADIVDRLPHGRLERHLDLGHFGPMEAPGAMATSVLGAFVDDPRRHRVSDPGPTIDP